MVQPQYDYRTVLVDFGFGCSDNENTPMLKKQFDECSIKSVGSLSYMRPELLLRNEQRIDICYEIGYFNFGSLADVWAVGCIIYQLMNNGEHYKFRINDSVNKLLNREQNIIAGNNGTSSKTKSKMLKEIFLTNLINPSNQEPYITPKKLISDYSVLTPEIISVCVLEFNNILDEYGLRLLMDIDFTKRNFDMYINIDE